MENAVVKVEEIESRIIELRMLQVMIDTDLAVFFDVETGYLNERVKNNIRRFPDDFRFQITKEEQMELIEHYPHLEKIKFSPNLPYAYTYPGAFTLAFILRSEIAVNVGISITRAFENIRKKHALFVENAVHLTKLDKLSALYYELQAEHKMLVKQNEQLLTEHLESKEKLIKHERNFEMMASMFAEIFDKIDEKDKQPYQSDKQMGFKPPHLDT